MTRATVRHLSQCVARMAATARVGTSRGDGAYEYGDYGRGDYGDTRRAPNDAIARSSPVLTPVLTPPTEASSSHSHSLNIGIHDRRDDAPGLYYPAASGDDCGGYTPLAWAWAHRDVVPPTLATSISTDEWARCLEMIRDAQTRHPCRRCPTAEAVGCLCGLAPCVAINYCNPLCWIVYCPYAVVIDATVKRMNAEILRERGVFARLNGDRINFDVVENAPSSSARRRGP